MKVNIEVDLKPEELAKTFIEWNSIEQAEFLNLIGKSFKEARFNAEIQCDYLSDDINKDGKTFIYTIANFLKAKGINFRSPKFDGLINSYKNMDFF